MGERYLDTVEVGGSIPPVPTIPFLVILGKGDMKRKIIEELLKGVLQAGRSPG